jgi:MFS family permease
MVGSASKCCNISQKGLAIFMGLVLNTLVYFDKGALASIVHLLESDDSLDLTVIEVGLLGFMPAVGYILGIPIYTLARRSFNPMILLVLGLFIWTGGAVLFGIIEEYYTLLIARALTGLGEAAYTYLVPMYILDIYDEDVHRTWFTCYFGFVWMGYGTGYLIGTGVAYNGEWMYLFILESVGMFVCAVFIVFVYAFSNRIENSPLLLNDSGRKRQESYEIYSGIKHLLKNRLYLNIILGYGGINVMISGYIYWATYYCTQDYDIADLTSLLLIGFMLLGIGLLGSLFGLLQTSNSRTTSEHLISKEDFELLTCTRSTGYTTVRFILGSLMFILATSVPSVSFLISVSYLAFILHFM